MKFLTLESVYFIYVIIYFLDPRLVLCFEPSAFQIQNIVDLLLDSFGITSFTSVSFLLDFSKP